jgi:hypothetical protein
MFVSTKTHFIASIIWYFLKLYNYFVHSYVSYSNNIDNKFKCKLKNCKWKIFFVWKISLKRIMIKKKSYLPTHRSYCWVGKGKQRIFYRPSLKTIRMNILCPWQEIGGTIQKYWKKKRKQISSLPYTNIGHLKSWTFYATSYTKFEIWHLKKCFAIQWAFCHLYWYAVAFVTTKLYCVLFVVFYFGGCCLLFCLFVFF